MSVPLQLTQWLFRHRRNEPSPIILGQRRIFLLPTQTGILFALVLLLMYSGAINYNLGLGHALVFLLAGLALVAMLHAFRNVYGLQIMAGLAQPVFAGERADFAIYVENPVDTARGQIVLRSQSGAVATTDVPARSGLSLHLLVDTHKRGWLDLGRLTLSSRYPLGLFHVWAYPHPAMRCLVYPRPLYFPLPSPTPWGAVGQSQHLAGDEDFAGFRNRQPGDSTRQIAWKSFARDPEHRPLQVKQFSGGQQGQLWLSLADLEDGLDLEDRLSVLSGWVVQAEEAGLPFGLLLPTATIPIGSGAGHAARCLEALALFAGEASVDVA